MSSVKTDVSRMFHGVAKVTDSSILCDRLKSLFMQYVKIVVTNNILRKHYFGITLIQKV